MEGNWVEGELPSMYPFLFWCKYTLCPIPFGF